jgi:F-type H+-transporting ATPase subunit alpha
MVELLKQPQYRPLKVVDQVMVIYAGTKGYLDKVPRKQVAAWEEQFLRFMSEQKADIRNALLKTKKLSPDLEKQLVAAIGVFQQQFKA